MFDIWSSISASLLETLPLIPAAIGFYIALRALKFPDLTVEGSFILGAVISAFFIQNSFNPIFAILIASIAGMFAGLLTALWNIWLKIPPFTSGIITTFALTSLNYWILKLVSPENSDAEKHMISSLNLNDHGIFEYFISLDHNNNTFLGETNTWHLVSILLIVLVITIIIFIFLNTHYGLIIRAFGSDKKAGNIYSKKYYMSLVIGLALTNSLVAISGALATQSRGIVNIDEGATLLIPLLAAVIFGEYIVDFIYKKIRTHNNKITKPILSRPLGLAFAPTIGFFIFNMIVLLIGAILIPNIEKIDMYHKYWLVALSIIIILAFKKSDIAEKHSDELI